jgi:hypothetical protein
MYQWSFVRVEQKPALGLYIGYTNKYVGRQTSVTASDGTCPPHRLSRAKDHRPDTNLLFQKAFSVRTFAVLLQLKEEIPQTTSGFIFLSSSALQFQFGRFHVLQFLEYPPVTLLK